MKSPEALYYLGCTYEKGLSVAPCEKTAYIYFHKAAELGHARAQFKVAECLFSGKGTSQDYEAAFAFYKLSAAQVTSLFILKFEY